MEKQTEGYIPIPIADFIIGTKTPVNLYIRLSDEKVVLIAKAGAETNRTQLSSFRNKEVLYLWVKKDDYHTLTQQSIAFAGVIIEKKDIDLKSKSRFLSVVAKSVFSQLEHMGLGVETYSNAKAISEAVVAMAESHRDLSALLESVKNSSDALLAHSLTVSTVATMIGVKMGWEKKTTLEKLALGGLLHDIGKKAFPPELLQKSMAAMTPEETSLYETHCYRGMQMVSSLGMVPDDVVAIIYEHHENSLGQGYPQRIRDLKIHPLARVVGLADQFVNLVIKGPNTPNPKNPREAIMYIEHVMGQPFNKDAFRALKKVVSQELCEDAA